MRTSTVYTVQFTSTLVQFAYSVLVLVLVVY